MEGLSRLLPFVMAAAFAAGAAEAQAQEPAAYAFPLERDLVEAGGAAQFPLCERTFPDGSLDFRLPVRRGWTRVEAALDLAKAKEQPQTLALFRPPAAEGLAAEIEVQVHPLFREVTAEQWLDRFVAQLGGRVVQGRTVLSPGGPAPDWLVEARGPQKTYVFRLAAQKDGARLFLLSGRAEAPAYPGVASEFAAAVVGWRLSKPTGARYAEKLLEAELSDPVRFTVRWLESWAAVEPTKVDPGVGGRMFKWGAEKELLGLIAVKAYAKARHEGETLEAHRARVAADWKELGLELREPELLQPAKSARFPLPGLLEIRQGKRGERAVESRALVLQTATAWFVIEMVGPTAAANAQVWAVNKRAFEVTVLELEPRE